MIITLVTEGEKPGPPEGCEDCEPITFDLDDATYAKYEAVAGRAGVSVEDLILAALEDLVDNPDAIAALRAAS